MKTTLREQVRQKEGQPRAAILDSQSDKTTALGGERGFDSGKKVKGRKHPIGVDRLANLLGGVVHPADSQDRDGAQWVLNQLPQAVWQGLERIGADGAYGGKLVEWVKETLDGMLDILLPPDEQVGFVVLPKRWIVAPTLAWFGRYRGLSKDDEQRLENTEGRVYLASIHHRL